MLAAFALLASAAPALAARVTDVRIGVHPDKTRIVVQLDAPASYQAEQRDAEYVVHLSAAAKAQALTTRSPQLVWVKVNPLPGGDSELRVQLRGATEVKHFVLRKPDRVVIDVMPASARATAATPAPAPAPPPAPSAVAPPVAAATAPEAEVAAAEEASPELGEGPGDSLSDETREAEAMAEAETAPAPGEAGAAAEGTPQVEVLRPSLPEIPEPPIPAPRSVTGGGPLDFLPPPLNDPFTLGLLALLLVTLFAWTRIRRRRAEEEALTPFPLDESEQEEAAAEPVAPALGAAAEADDGDGSLFESDEPVLRAPSPPPPARESGMPVPPPRPPVAPAAAAAGGDASASEVERRIGYLETRLEELVDARERLERQVAAQTEELRVQRAAIARTQRVLRTISRPEDEASEPVPKG